MPETDQPDIDEIIEQARRKMTVTTPDNTDYNEVRQLHNQRLQTYPRAIAHCENADHFSWWMKALKDIEIPISIRSGGHHHEAMSSNDGGVVLLSNPAKHIEISDDLKYVWLGSGQRLGNVIDELAKVQRLMPTGGCETVCVGGLTHGGGWGLSYRMLGATVDKLIEVEMVLQNGEIVIFNNNDFLKGDPKLDVSAKDLYWAICGGGGGNFGVVTRFRFELHDPGESYAEFTLQWDKEHRIEAAVVWAELCRGADERLNTFARMSVVNEPDHNEHKPAFVVGGRFFGSVEDCKEVLGDLFRLAPPKYRSVEPKPLLSAQNYRNALLGAEVGPVGSDGNPLPPSGYAMQIGAPYRDGPSQTCVPAPEPHKVSSAFPALTDREVFENAADFIDRSEDMDGVSLYLSFHGMGGKAGRILDNRTAFPWRSMPYMLQVQAWWLRNTKYVNEKAVVNWVEDFRKELTHVCRGAFINFPDRNQETAEYYDASWRDLKRIKFAVDPDNRLEFEMGIPPEPT